MRVLLCAAAMTLCLAGQALAQVWITEWAYSASPGEFIELTNVGLTPVDLTGWSYDDDSQLAGTFSLSGFGTLAVGESAVLTEATEADFRLAWSLAPTVKVLGGYTNNLSRNDEINIYDSSDILVDRLKYGDQDFPGTIRTQNISGNPITAAALGANDPAQWQLSFVGDSFGTYSSADGNLGNPGFYPSSSQVPEPTTLALGALSLCGLMLARRSK